MKTKKFWIYPLVMMGMLLMLTGSMIAQTLVHQRTTGTMTGTLEGTVTKIEGEKITTFVPGPGVVIIDGTRAAVPTRGIKVGDKVIIKNCIFESEVTMDIATTTPRIRVESTTIVGGDVRIIPMSVSAQQNGSFTDSRDSIRKKAPVLSEIQKTALEKMKESAQTFDQWLQVWEKAPADSEIQKTALEKMKESAQTFDQWLQVWEKAPAGSEIEKTASEKMKGFKQTSK